MLTTSPTSSSTSPATSLPSADTERKIVAQLGAPGGVGVSATSSLSTTSTLPFVSLNLDQSVLFAGIVFERLNFSTQLCCGLA
jgi:hypothetical protein